MLEAKALAKVNLFLRILAREESGFHQLETLFCALELADELTMRIASAGVNLTVEGPPLGSLEDNLVHRACRAFLRKAGLREGVEVLLRKSIPPGAGLGGGSSDAASALRLLRSLFPGALTDEKLLELAVGLGSDVPFFLSGSPLTLAWGRGERMLPLPPLPAVPVVVALPPFRISTPEAYGALDRHRGAPLPAPDPRALLPSSLADWESIGGLAENDFESPVFKMHPLLAEIRDALQSTGAFLSLLSGSGAALFGLFNDGEDAASARESLDSRFPDVRFALTRSATSLPDPVEPSGT